jgi:ATP-binding cassette subfamily F protein 3
MADPTNHLDMDMRQALTVALQDFGGAILLISHDRHLLANTVDEFLIINEGNLSSFKGDLEDYRKTVLKGSSSKETAKKEKSELLPKLGKQEIKEIKNNIIIHEKTLKRLQRKLSETEEILNSPESYESDDGPDLHSLLRDQANLTSEIELTEQEWLELNEKLEGRSL